MQSAFKELDPGIYAGIFPKKDLSSNGHQKLLAKFEGLPEGEKIMLTIDSSDQAKANGYYELIKDIQVNYETERLIIIELKKVKT